MVTPSANVRMPTGQFREVIDFCERAPVGWAAAAATACANSSFLTRAAKGRRFRSFSLRPNVPVFRRFVNEVFASEEDCVEMTSSSSLDRSLILNVALPNGSRQEVFLQRGLTIGRTDANTVCIDHPDVERIHARVLSEPNDTMVLECQTDKSGVFVDGESQPRFRLPLTAGTRFRIGPASLECTLWQSPARDRWAANPWQVRCPRCHASLAEVPKVAKACPQCALPIFYCGPPAKNTDPESGGFEGWLPAQVGPYAIRSFVAEGGMGIVLRGLHTENDDFAAVKLLQLSDDPQAKTRFAEEVANVGRCVHPNIVRLQDSAQDGHLVWLALDWVDGKPLDSYIAAAKASHRTLAIETIADWIHQIVKGLIYLHREGIIHRDLKPGNVLVGRDASVKITDFSIAKNPRSGTTSMTRTGTVAGSAGYMSPEQQDGRRVGPETDIYSLGVVWYELLMLRRHAGRYRSLRAERSDCPAQWDDLIGRCLEFDPRIRPTLQQILNSLSARSVGEESIAETPSASKPKQIISADLLPARHLRNLASSYKSLYQHFQLQRAFIPLVGLCVTSILLSMIMEQNGRHQWSILLNYFAASFFAMHLALAALRNRVWVTANTAGIAVLFVGFACSFRFLQDVHNSGDDFLYNMARSCLLAGMGIALAAHASRASQLPFPGARWLPSLTATLTVFSVIYIVALHWLNGVPADRSGHHADIAAPLTGFSIGALAVTGLAASIAWLTGPRGQQIGASAAFSGDLPARPPAPALHSTNILLAAVLNGAVPGAGLCQLGQARWGILNFVVFLLATTMIGPSSLIVSGAVSAVCAALVAYRIGQGT